MLANLALVTLASKILSVVIASDAIPAATIVPQPILLPDSRSTAPLAATALISAGAAALLPLLPITDNAPLLRSFASVIVASGIFVAVTDKLSILAVVTAKSLILAVVTARSVMPPVANCAHLTPNVCALSAING